MRVAERAGTDRVPAGTAQKCGALSSGPRSPYWGLSGARNWELIQPFKRVFSTWTQSPSRPVAVNCVPLGAVPRTGAVPEGADLMFTPGRCKKTGSTPGATWGETSAVCGVGTSGEGTTDAPPFSQLQAFGIAGLRLYFNLQSRFHHLGMNKTHTASCSTDLFGMGPEYGF